MVHQYSYLLQLQLHVHVQMYYSSHIMPACDAAGPPKVNLPISAILACFFSSSSDIYMYMYGGIKINFFLFSVTLSIQENYVHCN